MNESRGGLFQDLSLLVAPAKKNFDSLNIALDVQVEALLECGV
jgi:hypothetical protein